MTSQELVSLWYPTLNGLQADPLTKKIINNNNNNNIDVIITYYYYW